MIVTPLNDTVVVLFEKMCLAFASKRFQVRLIGDSSSQVAID